MTNTRICLWSSPRNVSTAFMYSWAQRPDTVVVDEPLYGYYLQKTGAAHPGRAEILQAMDCNAQQVINKMCFGNYTIYVLFSFQNPPSKIYPYPQMLFTFSSVNDKACSVINWLRCSKVGHSKLVKALLNFAHIFSAGFSSGEYGGKKSRLTFLGTIKDLALWKAPLSNTRILCCCL